VSLNHQKIDNEWIQSFNYKTTTSPLIYHYQILSETHDQNMITMQGNFIRTTFFKTIWPKGNLQNKCTKSPSNASSCL